MACGVAHNSCPISTYHPGKLQVGSLGMGGRAYPGSIYCYKPSDLSTWPTGNSESRAIHRSWEPNPWQCPPSPFYLLIYSLIHLFTSHQIFTEHLLHPGPHSRAWGYKNNQGLVPVPFGEADGTHIIIRSKRDTCSPTAEPRRGRSQPCRAQGGAPEELIPEPGLEG